VSKVFNEDVNFNNYVNFFDTVNIFGKLEVIRDVSISGNSNIVGNLSILGNSTIGGNVTANSFIRSGGTSNAFLKADGSIDTTTYITAATVGGAVDNTGGQLVLRSGTGGFSAGIVTITSLNVNGNARITGILTVGTGSITLNGNTNNITGVSSVSDASGGYLSNPPGTILTIAASTAPAGYLKANGASLSTTTYATLFAAIGYTFGGSGSSFTLPDLRGEFIRGWDDGRGVDTGRTFGSAQTDAFKSHFHGSTFTRNNCAGGSGGADGWGVNGGSSGSSTLNSNAEGGTETRPRNIALLHCIKY
jgi:hypothetical protein